MKTENIDFSIMIISSLLDYLVFLFVVAESPTNGLNHSP